MRIVTLLSGGLDSSLMACLLKEQGHEQFPLFIDYGQMNIEPEWKASQNICLSLDMNRPEILNINEYGKFFPSGLTCAELDIIDDAFLPNRNALFLLLASSYAFKLDCTHIAIGFLNEDNHIFPDQTSIFVKAMESLIQLSLGKVIKILTPFITINKIDIIRLAEHKRIKNTYSCHKGTIEPCGKCIACKEFDY